MSKFALEFTLYTASNCNFHLLKSLANEVVSGKALFPSLQKLIKKQITCVFVHLRHFLYFFFIIFNDKFIMRIYYFHSPTLRVLLVVGFRALSISIRNKIHSFHNYKILFSYFYFPEKKIFPTTLDLDAFYAIFLLILMKYIFYFLTISLSYATTVNLSSCVKCHLNFIIKNYSPNEITPEKIV